MRVILGTVAACAVDLSAGGTAWNRTLWISAAVSFTPTIGARGRKSPWPNGSRSASGGSKSCCGNVANGTRSGRCLGTVVESPKCRARSSPCSRKRWRKRRMPAWRSCAKRVACKGVPCVFFARCNAWGSREKKDPDQFGTTGSEGSRGTPTVATPNGLHRPRAVQIPGPDQCQDDLHALVRSRAAGPARPRIRARRPLVFVDLDGDLGLGGRHDSLHLRRGHGRNGHADVCP